MQLPGRLLVLGLGLLTVLGCENSTTGAGGGFSSVPTVQPGDTLALTRTEVVAVSGVYLIPPGATFLTTRCIGEVSVTIEAMPGNPMINTCSGDGRSSQTNVVAGVSRVIYQVTGDAFAQVTVT